MDDELRYLSLCGMLGYGYPETSLLAGLEANPHLIGVDAGSTDPGPYYLGSGTGFVKDAQVRRDLTPALVAAIERGIPLIVGTAGGAGATPHLEHFTDILLQIAAERGLHFRLATIPADMDKALVLDAIRRGLVQPCGPVPELTAEAVGSCSYLVGQMGTGPFISALEAGADVIVAGRACDTAIFAAMPILRGHDPALALHAAKISECGTLCARPGGANDCLLCTIREDHFVVRPTNPQKACYPDTVAAHSLYEQPDPHRLFEPEGEVDLSDCIFEQLDRGAVRVGGARLLGAPQPSVKLEGATLRGYRAVSIAGVRDPLVIASLRQLEASVREAVARGIDEGDYTLRFIRYGLDGVTGSREALPEVAPREVGLVIEAVADTQERADTVVSLARSTALHQHFEGRKTTAGNLAFPFSPSDLQAGPVYEFSVYHLMQVADGDALFPIHLREV